MPKPKFADATKLPVSTTKEATKKNEDPIEKEHQNIVERFIANLFYPQDLTDYTPGFGFFRL